MRREIRILIPFMQKEAIIFLLRFIDLLFELGIILENICINLIGSVLL